MSRRRIAGVLLAVAAAMLALYGFWIEPSSLRLTSYDVAVPRAFKGLRIAVITDLHAGAPYIDAAKIDRVVAMTNAAKPDMIVLAGDYVSHHTLGQRQMAPQEIGEHLKPLHARLGVFAVLGNHDHDKQGKYIRAALADAGITMLENSNTVSGGIPLAGIGVYPWHVDLARAFSGLPPDGPVICITHSPDLFPKLPARCALTIAGHTHGGQVLLPLLGRPAVGLIASSHGQRYAIGIIREGRKTLFVSPGIGTTSLPLRIGVPPEISLLNLQ